MVKFGVIWHEFDGIIEIMMCLLSSFECEIGVTSVEKSSCIMRIKSEGFVILSQTFIIKIVVVQSKCLIVIVCGFGRIKFNSLLKPIQSLIVILILEIRQSKIILCRCIILNSLASLLEIFNAASVFFDLAIAVAAMEQCFETDIASFDVLESISEILNGVSVVHKSCVNKSAVKVIEAVIGFQGDGFFELSQGIIDLVEHHHAVASVCVVLGVFVIKTDSRAEIIHRFLVVSDSHESLASLRVIFSVSGAFVGVWS